MMHCLGPAHSILSWPNIQCLCGQGHCPLELIASTHCFEVSSLLSISFPTEPKSVTNCPDLQGGF